MARRVTLVPGDGTGPELTEATRRVLEATGVELDWDVREAGVDVMEEAGTPLPEETLDSIRANRVGNCRRMLCRNSSRLRIGKVNCPRRWVRQRSSTAIVLDGVGSRKKR